jgi:hypothetical protein
MSKIKGTVYRYGTQERIIGASVKAIGPKGQIEYTKTDDDGDFEVDVPDPGKWSFMAFDESSFPSKPVECDPTSSSEVKIYLRRLEGSEDRKKGFRFFYVLLGLLGGLIVLYVILHLALPESQPPLSVALTDLVIQTQQQLDKSAKMSQDEELLSAVAAITTELDTVLGKTMVVNAADKEVLRTLGARFEQAVTTDDKDTATKSLARLRHQIESPPWPGFILWDTEPWRFLEILLWALAGVLVNKIFLTGWYLRSRTFYEEGIVMHVAHLVTTPLMVLVAVFILSLVTLQITITTGSALTLDLSDPRIMVAVAFLLGVVPWPLWNFIESTGRRVVGAETGGR